MITLLVGVLIDLRRALAAGDRRTALALIRNLPDLERHPELRAEDLAALNAWRSEDERLKR